MFNLSSVNFKIADQSDKKGLIDFITEHNLEQNTSFTALDLGYEDLKPFISNIISHTIDTGVSIIAINSEGQIVGHIGFEEYKNETNDGDPGYTVACKHGGELMEKVVKNFFDEHCIDEESIQNGEYFHPKLANLDVKYSKTGLIQIMFAFVMIFCYKLGYKYIFGTSTTTRTATTSSRQKETQTSVDALLTNYDYSKHVFDDGTEMDDYIAQYVEKYGVDRNNLIKNCVVQAIRTPFTFDDFGTVETMIRGMWYGFYYKHIRKGKL